MRFLKKLGNKGFGLIELIVTVAILSIAGGSVATFMVASQNSYNNGAAETDLQYEAQLVANQLQELVIDASKGISYEYNATMADVTVTEFIVDDSAIDEDVIEEDALETKNLYVFDQNYYYQIQWDKDANEIYYTQYDASIPLGSGTETPQLLAQYVTAFSVDLRDIASNRTVKYSITFQKDGTGREYTTTHKIKLRNDILVNADYGDIYEVPPETPEINGVVVNPHMLYLWPGESTETTVAKDTLKVTPQWNGLTGSFYAPVWYYTGKTSELTAVNASGELSLGIDETGSVIEDVDHRFNVIASVNGFTDTAEVGVRWIDQIVVASQKLQSNGNAYSYEDYDLDGGIVEEDSKGYHLSLIGFTGSFLDDIWTNSSVEATRMTELNRMGGISISVIEGNDLIEVINKDANAQKGVCDFNVKNNIDFTQYSESNPAKVTIRFASTRAPFSEGYASFKYTDVTFEVKEKEKQVIDPSDGWKRGGTLAVDFSALPSDIFRQYEDGTYGAIDVYLQYYALVNGKYIYVSDQTIGNNGGFSSNAPYDPDMGMYYQNQGDHVYVSRLYYDGKDVTKAHLLLNTNVPYTEGYYSYGNYLGLARVVFTFIYHDDQSLKSGPYTVDIEPVSFVYSQVPSDDNSWTKKDEDYTIYMVGNSNNNNSSVIRVYYQLETGWENRDGFYAVKDDRFVFKVDNKVVYPVEYSSLWGGTYIVNYWLHDYTSVTSGKDDNGYWLDISIKNRMLNLLSGKTINVSYEESPYRNGPYETEQYAGMVPCKGSINIKVVNSNIDFKYWAKRIPFRGQTEKYGEYTFTSQPTIKYCPTPTELLDMGIDTTGEYYLLNNTERFLVKKFDDGLGIVYQKKVNGNWQSQWTKPDYNETPCYMTYQETTGKWKYVMEQNGNN